MRVETKQLSSIIDIKKIKVVNKSIDKAHGLPNECYTSKEYLTYERKKIFEDKRRSDEEKNKGLAGILGVDIKKI